MKHLTLSFDVFSSVNSDFSSKDFLGIVHSVSQFASEIIEFNWNISTDFAFSNAFLKSLGEVCLSKMTKAEIISLEFDHGDGITDEGAKELFQGLKNLKMLTNLTIGLRFLWLFN